MADPLRVIQVLLLAVTIVFLVSCSKPRLLNFGFSQCPTAWFLYRYESGEEKLELRGEEPCRKVMMDKLREAGEATSPGGEKGGKGRSY
tara:strand:+ start:998 stop:1264 length:267 start_codon:yes stop_codon:yes gene_type:complete